MMANVSLCTVKGMRSPRCAITARCRKGLMQHRLRALALTVIWASPFLRAAV